MANYKTPKRKIVIMTRLTDEEKQVFDSMINETGLSQADYIRKCVLQKSFRVNKVIRKEINTDDFKKIIGELGKIGANINQISRSLNEGWMITNLGKNLKSELQELNNLKEMLVRCVEENYGDY